MTPGRLSRLESFGPVAPVARFLRDWIARFLGVQGFDRAMAVAAYGYSALIPLLIVYASLLPTSRSFADTIVERFELTGASADTVRQAFAPTDTVNSGVTVLGVVLLLVSALSFARGMQRLYEGVYGLPTLGIRNTKWGLAWLAVICALVVIRPVVLGGVGGALDTIAALALSGGLWLATPYLLLGRRVRWTRLAPAAVLSTIGMTGVGIWSVIFMPHILASSSAEFGVIGIGFALLTWLVAVAVVLVVAASGGAVIADRFAARRVPRMTRRITWLGHATLLLELGDARLLTDPVLRDRVAHLRRHSPSPVDPRPVDAVLVSHAHHDHLDRPSLRALAGAGVTAVVPTGAARLLKGMSFGAVREVAAGDCVGIAGTRVRAVEAWHDGRRRPGVSPAHTLGYLADRVWFAGDTELHPRMAALRGEIDIALVPIWGWGPSLGPGHLDPEEAARVVALVEPEIVVPIHWGTFLPVGLRRRYGAVLADPPVRFAAGVASEAPATRVVTLAPGESFTA